MTPPPPPNYDFYCRTCELAFSVNHSMEDIKKMKEIPLSCCPKCDTNDSVFRVFYSINFTKASFLDGQRKNDENFSRYKKAAQFEVLAANTTNAEEKAEIKKEINKLLKRDK